MTFEPAVRAHLEATDPMMYSGVDVAARRLLLTEDIDRIFTLFGLPGPEVHAIQDHQVAVEGGTILVRTYRWQDDILAILAEVHRRPVQPAAVLREPSTQRMP